MADNDTNDQAAPVPSLSFWCALGLDGESEELPSIDFAGHVRQVAAIWPFTFVAQLVALTTSVLATFMAERVGLMARVVVECSVLAAVGLAALVVLKAQPMRSWRIGTHIRLAVGYGAVCGAGLIDLLWVVRDLPVDRMQLACFVSLLGAAGVTAMALHPVRAALLGFAASVALMIVLLAGISFGAVIGVGCLACLAIATRRLAMIDADEAAAALKRVGQGKLAARLVCEFESQGSGWFWQTDRQGNVIYLSEKVAAAVATPGESPIGRPLTELLQMDSVTPGTERTLAFHLSSRTGFTDYPVRPVKLGTIDNWWSISGRPMADEHGDFEGFIGSGADLTEKRRAEAEITQLALFDGLTGLANRQRMRVSLDKTLNQPKGPYRPTTLMLLDLDRFKVVNDTLGHQTGDALLIQVAQRLLRAVGDAGLVGRLGGDEFQVVLPGADNADRLSEMARTIIGSLSQPYTIDGTTITIGCSIGVAIAPQDGEDSETLVRNADLALYAAKADGRGVHRFYREELLHGAQNRKQLEDDLRHALLQNELYLAYQPVVDTTSEQIVGFEALLRWEHPVRGAISPVDFIPVAEDCGLIESIGEWVIRTACLEAAKWPSHVRVGVNVSPVQFANPSLPSIVTNALAKAGIVPGRLELEITEGVFLDESDRTHQMFKALKGVGVRLALDDFGTGYSSLGYLKSAPFDKIKIDQSFVRGAVTPGNRNAAIISAIVSLATSLSMETTAEGAETQDEIDLIRSLGCSHIQGFVYGKPARAEDLGALLAARDGKGTPVGYRISRNPRTAMIRSATLHVGDARGEVRIRNISSTGVMIDGINFGKTTKDIDVQIELLEGQLFTARLRWAKDGKAGLQFAEPFNMERLAPQPQAINMRKVG